MGLRELQDHVDVINQQMARYGVKFGIYKNGSYNERLFPFDPIPRIIEADEFQTLERGLAQRVNALNKFLADIYADKNIIHEGVVPEEFVYRSPGYLAQCEGIRPPEGIYSHISGIDLVKGKNGVWYVLEDNLRIPSGASYPLIARSLCRQCCPQTFRERAIRDNRGYGQALKAVMNHVNCGGINVILTPGRYNSAYFEHSYISTKSRFSRTRRRTCRISRMTSTTRSSTSTTSSSRMSPRLEAMASSSAAACRRKSSRRSGTRSSKSRAASSRSRSSISKTCPSWTANASSGARPTCAPSCSRARKHTSGPAASRASRAIRRASLSIRHRVEVSKTHGFSHIKQD